MLLVCKTGENYLKKLNNLNHLEMALRANIYQMNKHLFKKIRKFSKKGESL